MRERLKGWQIKTKTQFYIQQNDFLISKRQIIHGACGIVPEKLNQSIVSNEYAVLKVKENCLLDFLKYFCHTMYFQQICFHSSVGVDVEKMLFNMKRWFSHKLHLPPLEEQKKIAEILSTWDQGIDKLSGLIERKKHLKKGLMQKLLTGRVRFEEFVIKQGFQNTELGLIPIDWEIVRFKEIADINALTLSESNLEYKEFFYLDISSISQGKIDFPTHKITSNEAPSRARRIIRENDVLVSCVRPNLQSFAIIKFPVEKDFICSTGFAVLTCLDSSDAEYLYQFLYSNQLIDQINKLLVGSNYPAINSTEASSLFLPYPRNRNERVKIAEILSTQDKEINDLEKKLELFKQQKKGLMQILLTGRVRV